MLRYLWALPGTAVGLPLLGLAVLSGGRVNTREGIVEVSGGWLDPLLRRCVPIPGGAMAMTLGHIIVARSSQALDASLAHERVHVKQYERWGPFFIPAYLLSSLYLICTRQDPYRDNPFEKEAFAGTEI